MQSSSTPSKFPRAFCDTGTKQTVPELAASITQTNQASLEKGFPASTLTPASSGGLPPLGQDFNGILNAITAAIRWNQAGGLYTYDSAFATGSPGGYPKGAVLLKSTLDGFWRNTVENNTSNPDSGGSGWVDAIAYNRPIVDGGSATSGTVDSIIAPGYYNVDYGSGNSRTLLVTQNGSSVGVLQIEFDYTGIFRWRNKTNNTTWTPWRNIWTTQNFDPSGYAPLASPALTGTPTVPTASLGTNTTQAASTAFVAAGISALSSSVSSSLALKQDNLGFTPVQQGGGVGQLTNKVYVGYSSAGALKATVDSTDLGNIAFESWVNTRIGQKFYSGSNANGSYFYLNGMLIQFGYLSASNATFTYPLAFSSFVNVMFTPSNQGAQNDAGWAYPIGLGLTQFFAGTKPSAGGTSNMPGYWIALGAA